MSAPSEPLRLLLLATDASWAAQLDACLAHDASIGSATPWCNAGETAAWPRLGEIDPETEV